MQSNSNRRGFRHPPLRPVIHGIAALEAVLVRVALWLFRRIYS